MNSRFDSSPANSSIHERTSIFWGNGAGHKVAGPRLIKIIAAAVGQTEAVG